MPVHDWTRVSDGAFHDFHQDFIITLRRRLNDGLLPPTVYAVTDRKLRTTDADDPLTAAPDVLAVSRPDGAEPFVGGLSVDVAPPRVMLRDRAEPEDYVHLANRLAVRTVDGDELVAVVELVSPGNKSSRKRLRQFVAKTGKLLRAGVHLLVIDLHPPTRRDPDGLHPLVWGEIIDRPFRLPDGKPFTLASYSAGCPHEAFVQPVGLGDPLPDMPLFITGDRYVSVPLEAVYMDSWANYPRQLKQLVEPPADA